MFPIRIFRCLRAALLVAALPAAAAGADTLPVWHVKLAPTLAALTETPALQALDARREAAEAVGRSGGVPSDPMLEMGVEMWPLGRDPMAESMAQAPMFGLRQRWMPAGLGAERRMGRALAEAGRAMAVREAEELAMQIAELAIAAGQVEAELRIVEEALRWLDVAVPAAKIRGGMGEVGEAARTAAERAQMLAEREWLAGEAASLAARWHGLAPGLGRPDPAEWPTDGAWLPASTPTVDGTPATTAAAAELAMAEAELSMRRSAWVPELELGVSYGVRPGGGPDVVAAMLGVGVPLWGARRQAPAVDAARAGRAAAAAQLAAVRARAAAQLQALADQHAAASRRERVLADELLPLRRTAQAAVWEAYRSGRGEWMQVQAAAEKTWETQRMLAEAVAMRQMLEARWLAEAGLLMPREVSK